MEVGRSPHSQPPQVLVMIILQAAVVLSPFPVYLAVANMPVDPSVGKRHV